jgi:hypothetical protein
VKFAVTVNDGAKHIVPSRTALGALKAVLSLLESSEELPGVNEPMLISIVPIIAKAKAKPTTDPKPEQVVG